MSTHVFAARRSWGSFFPILVGNFRVSLSRLAGLKASRAPLPSVGRPYTQALLQVPSKPKPPLVTLTHEDGTVVCERCTVASTPLRRMKGLLGKSELPPGEGLLIRPASSIHMFFMRFAIDVVFVDKELVVRKVARGVKPWRVVFARGARSVIELAAGEAERRALAPGQRLILKD